MARTPVTVNISGYLFSCVPLAEASFAEVAAVYVILCVSEGGSWRLLDVGQTGELGERFDSHERKQCWEANCPNHNLWACVHLMPSSQYAKEDRLKLEHSLRQQYGPPCGKI